MWVIVPHLVSQAIASCTYRLHQHIQTINHIWVQPVAPQSLVKPSGRLEREVAPDLGLAGAAQLGIKLGSQSKPAAAPTPAQAPSASKPSSSHRSQGHPSTSGRQVLYNGMTFIMARNIMARRVKTCMMGRLLPHLYQVTSSALSAMVSLHLVCCVMLLASCLVDALCLLCCEQQSRANGNTVLHRACCVQVASTSSGADT